MRNVYKPVKLSTGEKSYISFNGESAEYGIYILLEEIRDEIRALRESIDRK